MNISALDQKVSAWMYHTAKSSRVLRPFAIFCASSLLFVMWTALVMIGHGGDPMWPMINRFITGLLSPSILLLITWGVVIILQRLFKRPRPFHTKQGESLIVMTWETPSFPSAHTALAFGVAMLGMLYANELFGPWLWVFACFIAWSRVAVGVHYVSDVLVGALLGSLVTFLSFIAVLTLLFQFGLVD